MALPIFPLSPMPANVTRMKDWSDDTQEFDSGLKLGFSPWQKPLYGYVFPIKAMNELKQATLWAFVDTVKQTTNPFLMKDPYDYRVNSVLGVRSGITNAATLFLYDTNSYMVRADTISIGSLFSVASGFVRLGVQYGYDQDTGILTVNTKATTDVWGVRSMEYWKKARFRTPWSERAIIWNIFGVDNVSIKEEP